MHKTNAGERRKALRRDARELARDAKAAMKAAKIIPEAGEKARELQGEADAAHSYIFSD
jgi:regulator of protease activity HflC (stomatin/prohibitin superfamily)